jgi:hypothetical protein
MSTSIRWVLALAGTLALTHSVAFAQEADNGTDPTKLRRTVSAYYEHMDFGSDIGRGTIKLTAEAPIADRTSLRFTLPLAAFDAPGLDSDLALGDLALRVTHILDTNRARGLVLQGEIFADTAERAELGYGTTVLKGTAIYAKFLQGGRIFAPALSHSQSVDDRNQVRETVLDFYYVPKLPDPAWYMTVDPAVVKNWEGDKLYGSLAVTAGRAVGKIGGGLAQLYAKPSVFIGNERPADWALEVGFRVIGF